MIENKKPVNFYKNLSEITEKAIKEIFEAVNNQNKLNTSFRIIKENGAIAHIKADALVITNTDGKPIKMIGMNRDITEQKELENKLKQYKHFFQNSNDFLNISNNYHTPNAHSGGIGC